MPFSALIFLLAFVISSGGGLYMDQGGLYKALVDLMDAQPYLHKITVEEPVKIVRKGPCEWSMLGSETGEYGHALILMGIGYTKDSWAQTFPCMLTKGSPYTTCQGPLPEEAGVWKVVNLNDPPVVWTGLFPEAPPKRQQTEPTAFEWKLDCESLGGLAVAKAVQCSRVYVGNATLTCESASNYFYGIIQADGMYGRIYVNYSKPRSTVDSIMIKNVSWESWFKQNRLVISMDAHAVSYTKDDLSKDAFNSEGVRHDIMTYHGEGEARVCSLSSMTTTCVIMNSLLESETETLGNVTGFKFDFWDWISDNVKIKGTVLRTHGLVSSRYAIQKLDATEAAWMEMPNYDMCKCKKRIYRFSDCFGLPSGAPSLGCYTQMGNDPLQVSLEGRVIRNMVSM